MTTNPELSTHRAYALVNGRKVHYRRWGNGPAILAIHGSPQSSRTMEILGQRLAKAGFGVIAPDTPGNGLSSPLNATGPTSTIDYAQALLDFADEIGLGRFAIYGFHTGATIASTLAVRNPERVTVLACDGLPSWSNEERQTILQGYLPHFEANWDASHMCWLWARLEEQTVFFPWQMTNDQHRMIYDVSPPPHIHANALDLLESDDHYRNSYRAAFTFRAEDWLPLLVTPTLVAAMELDPLASHFQRPSFKDTSTQAFQTIEAMHQAFETLFLQHPGDPISDLAACRPDEFNLTAGWVGEKGKALAWAGNIMASSQQRPLVLLHDAGGSMRCFQGCLSEIAKHRPVLALDLPGHGSSDRRDDNAPASVEDIGREVGKACRQLGLQAYDVAGLHLGGLIASWLVNEGCAQAGATLGASLVDASDRKDWSETYAPSLEPVFDGAHLVRAYRIARWERLFFPWFKRDRNHTLKPSGSLEANDIHLRSLDLLRAGNSWQQAVQAEADYDLAKQCPPKEKFKAFAIDDDPRSDKTLLGQLSLKVETLNEQASSWANSLKQVGISK